MGYHDGYGNLTGGAKSTSNAWLAGFQRPHDFLRRHAPDPCYSQDTVLNWMGVGATPPTAPSPNPAPVAREIPRPAAGLLLRPRVLPRRGLCHVRGSALSRALCRRSLAAPFTAPPVITVSTFRPYQIVTGGVPLQVSAAARSNGVPARGPRPLCRQPFRRPISPRSGRARQCPVGRGRRPPPTRTKCAATDSLFAAVSNLAAAVNADSNQIVAATAAGDRLELVYKNFDHGGDNAAVTAAVAPGPAAALTLGTGLARRNLVPPPYPARKMVWLEAHTASGASSNDALICVITLTNSAVSSTRSWPPNPRP